MIPCTHACAHRQTQTHTHAYTHARTHTHGHLIFVSPSPSIPPPPTHTHTQEDQRSEIPLKTDSAKGGGEGGSGGYHPPLCDKSCAFLKGVAEGEGGEPIVRFPCPKQWIYKPTTKCTHVFLYIIIKHSVTVIVRLLQIFTIILPYIAKNLKRN